MTPAVVAQKVLIPSRAQSARAGTSVDDVRGHNGNRSAVAVVGLVGGTFRILDVLVLEDEGKGEGDGEDAAELVVEVEVEVVEPGVLEATVAGTGVDVGTDPDPGAPDTDLDTDDTDDDATDDGPTVGPLPVVAVVQPAVSTISSTTALQLRAPAILRRRD